MSYAVAKNVVEFSVNPRQKFRQIPTLSEQQGIKMKWSKRDCYTFSIQNVNVSPQKGPEKIFFFNFVLIKGDDKYTELLYCNVVPVESSVECVRQTLFATAQKK